jgi:hypothetical protein
MNRRKENADTLFSGHGEGQFVDHFSRMARDQSASQNSTRFLVIVNPREAFVLAALGGLQLE